MQHEQALLQQLLERGQIYLSHPEFTQQRIQNEISELNYIKNKKPGYLNQYDQLFRLINLWLLVRGYDLSNYQPHQVLKAVCLLNCTKGVAIHSMIQQRHQLKHQISTFLDPQAERDLQHCVEFFLKNLQAYIFQNDFRD